jgi:hypothetical protein
LGTARPQAPSQERVPGPVCLVGVGKWEVVVLVREECEEVLVLRGGRVPSPHVLIARKMVFSKPPSAQCNLAEPPSAEADVVEVYCEFVRVCCS